VTLLARPCGAAPGARRGRQSRSGGPAQRDRPQHRDGLPGASARGTRHTPRAARRSQESIRRAAPAVSLRSRESRREPAPENARSQGFSACKRHQPDRPPQWHRPGFPRVLGFGRNDASRKAGALPNAIELRRRICLAALSADPRRHTLIVGAGDICRPEVARRAARVGAFPSHGRKHMMTHPSRSDAVSSGAVSLPNSVAMPRTIRPYMRRVFACSAPRRMVR
jgi:hypothetical protein